MSITQLVNSYPEKFWSSNDNSFIGYVPVPGLHNVDIIQEGRTLKIHGSNPNMKVSYSFDVLLHPDASDNPNVRVEAGMVVISCDKVSNIKRQLLQVPPCIGIIQVPVPAQ